MAPAAKRGVPKGDFQGDPALRPTLGADTHVLNLREFEKAQSDLAQYRKAERLAEIKRKKQSARAQKKAREDYFKRLTGGAASAKQEPEETEPQPGSNPELERPPAHVLAAEAAAAAAEQEEAASPISKRKPSDNSDTRPKTCPPPVEPKPRLKPRAETPTLSPVKARKDLTDSTVPFNASSFVTSSPDVGALSVNDFTSLMTLIQPEVSYQARVRQLNTLDDTVDITWIKHICGCSYKPIKGSLSLSSSGIDQSLLEGRAEDISECNFSAKLGEKLAVHMPPTRLRVPDLATDCLLSPDNSASGNFSRDSLKIKGADQIGVLLSSPRSAIACLRTGIGPMDLQEYPLSHFTRVRSGVNHPPEVARRRMEAYEERRKAKLNFLIDEYERICTQVPFELMMNFYAHYDPTHPASAYDFPILGETSQGDAEGLGRSLKWMEGRKVRSERMIQASKHRIKTQIITNKQAEEDAKRAMEISIKAAKDKEEALKLAKKKAEQEAVEREEKRVEWLKKLKDLDDVKEITRMKKAKEQEERDAARAEIIAQSRANKQKKMEAAKKVAEERLLTTRMHQDQLHQSKLEEAARREERAEERRKARLREEEEKLEARKAETERKNRKRTNFREQALAQEAIQKASRLSRFEEQEQRYQDIKEAREWDLTLTNTAGQLKQEAKWDFSDQQRKVKQFSSIKTIDHVQRKRDRIERNEDLKRSIAAEVVEEWNRMLSNKEKIAKEVEDEWERDKLEARLAAKKNSRSGSSGSSPTSLPAL